MRSFALESSTNIILDLESKSKFLFLIERRKIMRKLGKSQLGAITFSASSFPNDKCGANGLPLTPSSIQILGKFQQMKALDHPHLCRYVELVRGKHGEIINLRTVHIMSNH